MEEDQRWPASYSNAPKQLLRPTAMRLIGTYSSPSLDSAAAAALNFYERRSDLHCNGLSFGDDPTNPRKVSTDISLVWLDRSDADAFNISDQLMRAVAAGLGQYLKEHPLLMEVMPERSLFVMPLFNLQRYAPGEGFKAWHADWSTAADATEPIRRVLAWILYLNNVENGGTEFHWQNHHVEAVQGRLAIFPAGLSHVHRGRVSEQHTKTIATGWINAGSLEAFVQRLSGARNLAAGEPG
jgi:hypothetical protein